MNNIASEKEKRKLLKIFYSSLQWDEKKEKVIIDEAMYMVRLFFRDSLDHIASVARQEGREETAMQIIHDINDYDIHPTFNEPNRHSIVWGIMMGWGISEEDMKNFVPKKAKLTGKEEGK